MGRCIFVFCLPRSGSSALAGALHRMGVDMGEGFLQKPDALNPKGYYEDLRWHGVNKALSGYGYTIWDSPKMTRVVEKRIKVLLDQIGNDKPLWGFKSPRLAFTAPLIVPYIEQRGHEVRVLLTHRPFEHVVDSMRRHSQKAYNGQHRLTQRAAETMMARWKRALDGTMTYLYREQISPFEVRYDSVIDFPYATLSTIWRFAHDMPATDADIAPAVEWINPEMRHFK